MTHTGTEINLIDTTGAIRAVRSAGIGAGTFDSISDAFPEDEPIMTYHPINEKKTY